MQSKGYALSSVGIRTGSMDSPAVAALQLALPPVESELSAASALLLAQVSHVTLNRES